MTVWLNIALQEKVQSIVFRRDVFTVTSSLNLTPEGVTLNRTHFLKCDGFRWLSFVLVVLALVAALPFPMMLSTQASPVHPLIRQDGKPQSQAEINAQKIKEALAKSRETRSGGNNSVKLMVQLGHSDAVNAVAFSPDGRLALTGGEDGTTRIWEVETGKEVRRFEGSFKAVRAVAFSPDGRFALTGSDDGTARLWEVDTGKELRRLEGHSDSVYAVAFSPDGRLVLTGSDDETTRVWEVTTGEEFWQFEVGFSGIKAVAFSPDKRLVLTGGGDGTGRLWEVKTGQELLRLEGHSDAVTAVGFSPDGRLVLTGSEDKTARLWKIETGKQIWCLRHSGEVAAVAFSPDGRLVLTGSDDEAARLGEVETGKELRRLEGHTVGVTSVAFSLDGRLVLTGSWDQTARLWEVATGKELRRLEGHAGEVAAVAFSPDERLVLTGNWGDKSARLWGLATGKEIWCLHHSSEVFSIAFSPDGVLALTGSWDKIARLWDVETGKELRRLEGHSSFVNAVAFSPDGRLALTGSTDQTVRLWEVATGKELQRLEGLIIKERKKGSSQVETGFKPRRKVEPSFWVKVLAFSSDGEMMLTENMDNTAQLWKVKTRKEFRRLEGHSSYVTTGAFSPDGRLALTTSLDQTARLWDVETGKELSRMEGYSGYIKSVAFSPDGRLVLTGSTDSTACLWDVQTGTLVRVLAGHLTSVTSAQFSPNGKWVMTGSEDGTTRLWDVATGQELCQLISFKDGGWAVVDPEGRFDASNGGDVQGLHWVVGNEAIDLKQFKELYYEPGLLAKITGFNPEPVRPVVKLTERAIKLYPEVQVSAPGKGRSMATVRLTNRGGGIGKVVVRLNGKEIAADARGPKPDSQAKQLTIPVKLDSPLVIPGKPNTIEVTAYNAEGSIASRSVKVVWEAEGAAETVKPELYAIVAGVSDYAGSAIDLKYAAKDAADMAQALELGAKKLFGAEKVHLTLLSTDTTNPKAIPPTGDNLRRAFEAAEKSRPEDILVVYLAGHGVTLPGEQDVYCYLTQDAQNASLTIEAVRQQWAVTSNELTEWIKRIPALKQVMVLDTCAAGAAAVKLVEKRDVSSDQIRAIDRMKDRTGFHILMGSAANAVSYEATQYGQGLLTYALLQGIKGAALRENEFVDISRLFNYAADQVPQLARNIGGVQRPLIAAPRGTSFDIGQLTEAEKRQVPLSTARPLILRPNFLSEDGDVLELSRLVRKRLDDASVTERGNPAAVVYVDGEEMPGAVRPSGIYTVEGETVTINLVLRQDGQKIHTATIRGLKTDLESLVSNIVVEVSQASKVPPK